MIKTIQLKDAKNGDVVKFLSQDMISNGSILPFTNEGLCVEKWGQMHSKTFATNKEILEVIPKIS